MFSRSNAQTYAGVVSGTGTLTKIATNTLTLTGDNTYTGGTTISAGTLQIGNNGTNGSIVGNVLDDGVLAINRSDDLIFAGDISGTGALTKSRASTLTLTGSNTYSGSTTLSTNGSTLRAGAENTFSSASAHTLANNTILDLFGFDQTIGSLAGSGRVTNADVAAATLTTGGDDTDTLFSGIIQDGAGSTGLTKVGTGTFTLSGNNTYTGGTTITAGTLQLGNGGNSGSVSGDIIDNGVLVFDRNNNLTFSDIVSGTGSLTKIGTNTLTLTGNNTYTGSTTISAGTLQIGNGGTSGAIVGNVIDNGVLAINRSDAVTLGGVISGTGTLTKSGAGTLILTGENTYSGGTTISAGTLQIGNGGTTGSISGNMVDNGVFVFDRSDALTYAGNISGSGSLVKNGTGTLTLTGLNPYSGGTTINAGRLLLNNAVVPAPVVALPAAFLGGNGTIGPATIAGTLAPGFSIGTITVSGNMTFAASGIYLVEISPTAADRTNVTGAAALAGGSVQVEAATGTYTPGTTYTILNAAAGVNGTFAELTSNFEFRFPHSRAKLRCKQRVSDDCSQWRQLRQRRGNPQPNCDRRGGRDAWLWQFYFRYYFDGHGCSGASGVRCTLWRGSRKPFGRAYRYGPLCARLDSGAADPGVVHGPWRPGSCACRRRPDHGHRTRYERPDGPRCRARMGTSCPPMATGSRSGRKASARGARSTATATRRLRSATSAASFPAWMPASEMVGARVSPPATCNPTSTSARGRVPPTSIAISSPAMPAVA